MCIAGPVASLLMVLERRVLHNKCRLAGNSRVKSNQQCRFMRQTHVATFTTCVVTCSGQGTKYVIIFDTGSSRMKSGLGVIGIDVSWSNVLYISNLSDCPTTVNKWLVDLDFA